MKERLLSLLKPYVIYINTKHDKIEIIPLKPVFWATNLNTIESDAYMYIEM